MKKFFSILFVLISAAAMLEYLFVRGMFTGPLAMLFVLGAGIANAALAFKDRNVRKALLFLAVTVCLCMGYWRLML